MNVKNWVIVLLLLALSQPALAQNECYKTCITSPDGITTIQFFEGFSPFVYKDSGGLDTIGYGHLIVAGETIPQPLLGDAATNLLAKDLKRTERGLNLNLKVTTPQHRFDALSSFAFNIGVQKCVNSTLFRYVNIGRDTEAAGQFSRWVNVNGRPVAGLRVRRAAESRKYVGK